jgi:WD40 repeat protein
MAAATCEVAIAAQGVFDVRHPALLPDGRHVLFKWGLRDTHLGIGDLVSGDVSILLSGATDPTFVPPGLLVFGRGAQDLAVTPLWAQSFDPESLTLVGDPVRLSDAVRTSQGVASYAVSPGGTLLYQPGFGDRGYLLTDRRGSVIDTLVIPGAWSIQWGTAGRYIAAGNGSRPIAIYDLDRRLPTPLSGSSEWEDSWSPAWSPSDSLLAYAACTSTLACGIGVTRFADGRDTLVVPPDERYNVWPSSWSPSGRFLVYSRTTSFEPTGAKIWALDLVERRSELLFDQAPSLSTLEGAISPDGRWLAYRSDETGTWEVFVRPFMRAGASRRVSANGGRSPRWRADGGELFYQSPDGEVVAVSIIQGAEFAFASPVALFSAPGWSRHNFFDIGTSFDVSPDGQQFVVRMTATGTTAVLVRDWRALLR